MAKIVIVDERICKFLEAGGQIYRGAFPPGADLSYAIQLYLDMIISEYIVRRFSTLIPHEQLEILIEDPEKLFTFAVNYLRNKTVEFEEGAPADGNWTPE